MPSDFSDAIGFAVDLNRKSARVGKDSADVVRRHARQAETTMRALAPRRSGALANSITTEISGSGRGGAMSATIAPTEYYARFVENGTAYMSPQPFAGPTLDRVQPGFVADMEKLAEGDL